MFMVKHQHKTSVYQVSCVLTHLVDTVLSKYHCTRKNAQYLFHLIRLPFRDPRVLKQLCMPRRLFYFFLLLLDPHLFLFLTEFKIKIFRTDKTDKCSLMLLGKSFFWMQELLQFTLSIADHTEKSNKLLLKQWAFFIIIIPVSQLTTAPTQLEIL